jgi:hypothetical protein
MSSPVKGVPLAVPLAFVGMGLVFFAIGASTGWRSWGRVFGSRRVEGTVVELARIEPSKVPGPKGQVDTKPGFAPVVQYQVEGQTYRIQGRISSTEPGYSVGEAVPVRYSPDNPSDGTIDSFAEKWLMPLAFGGSGLLFALLGSVMLRARMGAGQAGEGGASVPANPGLAAPADNQSRIAAGLADFLGRQPEAVIHFEDTRTGRMVQFMLREGGLLLYMPFAAFTEAELQRAIPFFAGVGVEPLEFSVVRGTARGNVPGVDHAFQMPFGRDEVSATEVAMDLFRKVYGLPDDFDLHITEG